MAYASISFTAFEVPTAAKWNILGTNDAEFNSMIKHNGTIVEVGASGDTSIDIPVNNIPLRQDNSSGTPQDVAKIDSSNILQLGDSDLSGMSFNGLVWSTWSPTLTNLTIGNGTVQARYIKLGKMIAFRIKVVLGTTSSVGTGPSFSLPETAYNYGSPISSWVGTCMMLDAAVAAYAAMTFLASTTTVVGNYFVTSGANAVTAGVTATAPFTWGTGDAYDLNGIYEVA